MSSMFLNRKTFSLTKSIKHGYKICEKYEPSKVMEAEKGFRVVSKRNCKPPPSYFAFANKPNLLSLLDNFYQPKKKMKPKSFLPLSLVLLLLKCQTKFPKLFLAFLTQVTTLSSFPPMTNLLPLSLIAFYRAKGECFLLRLPARDERVIGEQGVGSQHIGWGRRLLASYQLALGRGRRARGRSR